MSEETIPGHVCGTGEREGAFQFVELDDNGAIVPLLEKQQGEFIRIRWIPTSEGAGVLFYGFFETAEAAALGFDADTSSDDGESVERAPTAPDWIERGSEDVEIPRGRLFLLIAASTGTGRALVRNADRKKAPVGT